MVVGVAADTGEEGLAVQVEVQQDLLRVGVAGCAVDQLHGQLVELAAVGGGAAAEGDVIGGDVAAQGMAQWASGVIQLQLQARGAVQFDGEQAVIGVLCDNGVNSDAHLIGCAYQQVNSVLSSYVYLRWTIFRLVLSATKFDRPTPWNGFFAALTGH